MLNDFMIWLSWSSPIVLIAGIGIGMRSFQKLDTRNRTIVWFLVLFLGLDLISRNITQLFEVTSNLHLLSWSALAEFCLFGWLYARQFITRKHGFLSWVIGGVAVLLLLNLLRISVPTEFSQFQIYDRLLVDGMLLLLGMFYLYNALDYRGQLNRREQVTNMVILFYAVVDLFMSLTINFMVNASLSFVFFFWVIRLVAMVLVYLNLIQSLWHNGKSLKPRSSG